MSSPFLIYDLYTLAFQDPAKDMSVLAEKFKDRFGHEAVILREDFCGSFANCLEWIRVRSQNVAIGIDIDPELAEFADSKCLSLEEHENSRFSYIAGDVLEANLPKAHIVAALNSSFCVFKRRQQFMDYLQKCFESFEAAGMIALETYCGPDSQNIGFDEIAIDDHTAIWEQAEFDPVTNYCRNYIHFRLEDGSRIKKAFEYDWRLWSPAECIDLLEEVGFKDISTVNKRKISDGAQVDTSQTLFILGFKHY